MVVSTLDLAPMLQLDNQWWRVLNRLKYRRRYQRTAAMGPVARPWMNCWT